MDEDYPIQATKKWIRDVVIGCNFCPFAAREMERNSVYFEVEMSVDKGVALRSLAKQCKLLDDTISIETSYLIFPKAFQSFSLFLNLIAFAQKELKKGNYEGKYQIASFHPQYLFAGVPPEDAANYTNRSPFPMLQLLREASVKKALKHYPHPPKTIPENNIAFARNKGVLYMQTLAGVIPKP